MKKPFWTDDEVIDRMNDEGIKPEVKALTEAIMDEYQTYRMWGIIQAWLAEQRGE